MQVFGLPRQVIKNGRALAARCQRRTERRPRRASGRRPTGDSLSLEKDVTPKSRRPRRLRPKTLDAGAPPGGRQGRRQLPRQAHRRHALPGEGHPGRRRKRVHGRVRGRLPRQGPRSLRSAAPQAANERRSRSCNGAWRYEFYETYDLPFCVAELNPILDSYQHLYNHHRPPGALAGKTPAQYLANRSATRPQPSHMC